MRYVTRSSSSYWLSKRCSSTSRAMPQPRVRRVLHERQLHAHAALAANLIKLANSATYAGHEPAASLNQVVVRIGTTALCELALVLASVAA
jgi:HD-like signal output (HDOD) protein